MELITQDIYEPRHRYQGRKGIYPIVQDFDAMFNRLEVKPILANELDLNTEAGRERFNRLVYTKYDGDVFTNVPACPCRHTMGGSKINRLCVECGFPVLPVTEQTIEPIVWVKVPDCLPGFMNLNIYRLLRARFIKSGFSPIDYLLDPDYTPPKLDSVEEKIVRAVLGDGKRGLSYFHAHFDSLMEGLCKSRHYIRAIKAESTLKFLSIHRHLVFCQYIPFPSKIGFIVENVDDRTYVDPKMAPALAALLSLAGAANSGRGLLKHVESRIARASLKLVEYYGSYEHSKIFDKKGIFRKLVYGVSPHFTFRTVITSNFKPHKHDSLEIPWGVAVLTFKLHLANKLLKEDYTPNEIATLIYDNVMRPHYKLEELFDELLAETPDQRGFPCTFTRFPSLKHGSTQTYYIDVIKRDPTQLSTSIPLLTIVASNADFDGDYMSGQLLLDNKTARAYSRHAPHTGIMDLKRPFRVSNHASIPAPALSTINAKLEEGDALSVPVEE